MSSSVEFLLINVLKLEPQDFTKCENDTKMSGNSHVQLSKLNLALCPPVLYLPVLYCFFMFKDVIKPQDHTRADDFKDDFFVLLCFPELH